MEEINETVNQEQPEKTFTQDEVNAIVSERLKRSAEKYAEKYADYESIKEKMSKLDEIEEANRFELKQAKDEASAYLTELEGLKKANEIKSMREKISEETGVPSSLLTYENEEECRAQAMAIATFAKPNGYPIVKDGGEIQRTSKPTTREQFADWLNNR